MNISSTTVFYLYSPAAVLRVEGGDAMTFLQGQCTADVGRLGMGESVYGLWLNQKGKVMADSFVIRVQLEQFYLVSYFCVVRSLLERLEPYVIADDVTFADETGEHRGVTIMAEEGAALAAREVFAASAPALSFPGRRGKIGGREIICAPAEATRYQEELLHRGAIPATEVKMETWRIAGGIPAVPRDIGPADLPQEGGLERDAISFRKGCFLGQEVMARLQAGGQVRRRLRRVFGSGPLPPLPAAMHRGGRMVGELRSAVALGEKDGYAGLALVSEFLLGTAPANTELSLGPEMPSSIQLGDRT